MSSLEDHLADLRPDRSILKLVRAAAAERAIASGRRADYVSLRPSDQLIACYVHRNRVSIAIGPHEAEAVPARIKGIRLERRGPTTYAVADAGVVARSHGDVLALLLTSIDWRAAGGRGQVVGQRSSKRVVREPEMCPTCWTQVTATGTWRCDDNL